MPVTPSLSRAGSMLRRRGLIVVVSDFYEEEADAGGDSAAFADGARRRRHSRHGARGADAAARRRSEFEDLETRRQLVASPEAIADEYRAACAPFSPRRAGDGCAKASTTCASSPVSRSSRRCVASWSGGGAARSHRA